MKNIPRLIILVMLSVHTSRAGVQQNVDSLVAQLPAFAAMSPSYNMGIPERGPVKELLDLGLEAVPFLVPHLSNMTMTKSLRVHGSGAEKKISVNEFVGHVITRSCGHYFYIGSGVMVVERLGDEPITNPETIALYQEQVRRWHAHFGASTESERKLVDIEDSFHTNRFEAYSFFAENPSPKGRQKVRARIQILSAEPKYDSMIAVELVLCSVAIAAMGDLSDLDLVKQVWNKEFMSSVSTSNRETNMTLLYQARVKLNDQQQAKKDIDAYNSKYLGRYPPIKVK